MPVGELSRKMSAAELMEWAAYFKLQDEAGLKEIQLKIAEERTAEETSDLLRAFFSTIRPTKNVR